MKKRIAIIVSIVLVLIMSIILLVFIKHDTKLTTYTEITYNNFNDKKENKDTFSLVIGSSTCSACAMYKPVMESFIENYQVEVFYMDISKLNDDEYNNLKTEISFTGTPTTVFYENGALTSFYNRIDGSTSIDTVINMFKKNNYIK